MERRFLPLNRSEMEERGWDQVDFAYVIGDAYVDHPSFGHEMCIRDRYYARETGDRDFERGR